MSRYDRTTILIVGLFLLGCVSPLTLAIFLFVCLITYIGLSLFLRGIGAHRYAFLAVLVPLQLFPLLYYKYSPFIVNDILGQELAGLSGLIITVGLSFYTLQVVGFVVDTVIHKHPLPRFLQVTDERRNFTVTTNKNVSLSLSPEGADYWPTSALKPVVVACVWFTSYLGLTHPSNQQRSNEKPTATSLIKWRPSYQ